MACKRCERQGIDHDALKKQCEENLFYFTKFFVSDWVSEDLHLPVTECVQEGFSSDQHYFLIMIPRGHLKTTTFTIAMSLWLIINNPDLRILLVMSSVELAKEKLDEIATIAQGEDFKHFWGDLVPDPKAKTTTWTKTRLRFNSNNKRSDVSIVARGAGSAMTGTHYDVQILDDLIDGLAENSAVMMKDAMAFMRRTDGLWANRKNPRMLVVGTFWPGGFYEELIKDDEFKKIIFGCYVDDRYREFMQSMDYDVSAMEDGDPVFERETKETLERSKKHFKSMFPHQMENLPVSDHMKRFRREDFVFLTWGDNEQKTVIEDEVYYPISLMYKQLTIDPGGGMQNSDESAIVVTGWVRGIGHAFVLDVWHGRVTTSVLIDKIFELAEKWNVNAIRPEYAAMQLVIGDWLKEEMRRKGKYYTIDPARHKRRGKGERIDGLQPFIAAHQVHFRRDQQDIIEEGISVIITDGKIRGINSPNMMDALAYHCDRWNSDPKHISYDEDDIPYVEDRDDPVDYYVRYGLECPTRSTKMRRFSI